MTSIQDLDRMERMKQPIPQQEDVSDSGQQIVIENDQSIDMLSHDLTMPNDDQIEPMKNKRDISITDKILKYKDYFLIIVLYVLLSLNSVQSKIVDVVPQLKPINGEVPLIGLVIYGVIFAVAFMIGKKILFKQ